MSNIMNLFNISYLLARAKHFQINFLKIHSKLFSNHLQIAHKEDSEKPLKNSKRKDAVAITNDHLLHHQWELQGPAVQPSYFPQNLVL